jgi:hypothetical protein
VQEGYDFDNNPEFRDTTKQYIRGLLLELMQPRSSSDNTPVAIHADLDMLGVSQDDRVRFQRRYHNVKWAAKALGNDNVPDDIFAFNQSLMVAKSPSNDLLETHLFHSLTSSRSETFISLNG